MSNLSLRGCADPNISPATRASEEEYCLSNHPSKTNEGCSNVERMSSIAQCFNQGTLNDLTRDLSLSKEDSVLLASRLKQKILKFFYLAREKDYFPLFSQEDNLVFYYDILEKWNN